MSDRLTIIQGDCLTELRKMPDCSVQCCVTSPPYWGLRDYGVSGQLGLEKTPEEYIAKMVEVFAEVRRVLRDDGTLWLNLGDSYARNGGTPGGGNRGLMHMEGTQTRMSAIPENTWGLKEKDLCGIPWRVALALQADGWWLRQDIIWHKPNPMPESVTDRCTKAHEYIFMLTKSARYYYDAESIKEPGCEESIARLDRADLRQKENYSDAHFGNPPIRPRLRADKQRGHSRRHDGFNDRWDTMEKAEQCCGLRNKRSVWTIGTSAYPEAHFATFPPGLIKPCILAGSKPGGIILDPFGGSGTTGMVAIELGRRAVLIELNPEYVKLSERRTHVTPGLALA